MAQSAQVLLPLAQLYTQQHRNDAAVEAQHQGLGIRTGVKIHHIHQEALNYAIIYSI